MNTVKELPDGRFDVQDESGKSVLDHLGGPTHTRNLAEQTARMLNAFDQTDASLRIVNTLYKALLEIANDPHNAYESNVGGSYGIGVTDGHRCAAQKARAALALVDGSQNQETK